MPMLQSRVHASPMTDLAARALELIDIPSESRDEAALAAHVLAVVPGARDAGDTCVLAGVTERGERPLGLLARHLHTAPPPGPRPRCPAGAPGPPGARAAGCPGWARAT